MNKKQMIQQAFDTVADGYDHPSLSFFPATAERMVALLELNPADDLLDICCGTGVVALRAATQLEHGKVTGIDLSPGMLAQAASKAAQLQLDNVRFMQMDLDKLEFTDEAFDIATCSFGLFFLDEMEQGLANIAAKVKTGGKVVISTFSAGAFDPMSSQFTRLYEDFGYEAPPLSWKQLCEDQALEDIFKTAGIDSIEIHREQLGFNLSSATDWWDIVWNAGYRGLLMQMTKAEQAKFKQQHLEEIQKDIDTGNNWLDIGVAIVVGQK